MKILVLADNYIPEITATSFRTHEHAQEWLKQGHDITVVTCVPNWPHGKTFEGYRNRGYQVEWIDGVRVIRVWSYMSANRGFLKRTLDYLSFMLAAVFWCWRFPKFDIILATSPQFFTAVAGWIISILRWRPWVFEVRDLWPASIAAVGAFHHQQILQWLERLELFLYRRAKRIIVVTESFRDNLVGRGIEKGKIDVITNGVDSRHFDPARADTSIREQLGISPHVFLTGYVGTTGMAHGLETLVEAARLCRDETNIQFLIIGDGACRNDLESLIREKGLLNIRIVDRVPRDQLPTYLSAFDLPIIHLRPNPLFRTVIPSKLFEWMAMGKPVLMAIEGEAARIVTDCNCGVCRSPGDAKAIATSLLSLAADREKCHKLGMLGRLAVCQHFNRQTKASAALQTLTLASGMEPSVVVRRLPDVVRCRRA